MKITSQLSLSRSDAEIPLQCRLACTVVHYLLILVEKGRVGGKTTERWSQKSRRAECDHGVVSGGQRPCHLSTERWSFSYSPLAVNTVGTPFISSASLPSFFKHHLLLQAPNEVKYSAYVPSTSQSISPSWPACSQSSKGLLKWKTQVQVNKKTFFTGYMDRCRQGILSHFLSYIPR